MNRIRHIDLIIFLSTDWKSYSAINRGYFGDVPFIKALSKLPGIRILCVNPPFTPVETMIKKRGKAVNWLKGKRLEKIGDNLFLYTPFAFIHEMLAIYSHGLQKMNMIVISRQLKKLLENIGFDSPARVSWIYHPLQYTYFGLVDEKVRIYKCWDLFKIRDYSDTLKKVIEEYEKKILACCDIALTPCINLFREMAGKNKNTYFTPVGVELNSFRQVLNERRPIPEDLERIKKPRIGFAGIITEKVDMSLIRFLAEVHRDWSIVLLGSVVGNMKFLKDEDYIACRHLPNVHFLGFREFEMLPLYFKYFDVCLLPYNDVELMKYAHPYKTLQYLAAGKPVVSTNIPDVQYYYADVVRIGKDYKEFMTLVEESLKSNSEVDVKKMVDFAQENAWGKRARETYDILVSHVGA